MPTNPKAIGNLKAGTVPANIRLVQITGVRTPKKIILKIGIMRFALPMIYKTVQAKPVKKIITEAPAKLETAPVVIAPVVAPAAMLANAAPTCVAVMAAVAVNVRPSTVTDFPAANDGSVTASVE
jgi:hypothetical protein